MKTLSKDEFLKLDTDEQIDYINEHAKKHSHKEWLYYRDGEIYDIDDAENPINENDLFDYALNVHYEATDLQGKLFLD